MSTRALHILLFSVIPFVCCRPKQYWLVHLFPQSNESINMTVTVCHNSTENARIYVVSIQLMETVVMHIFIFAAFKSFVQNSLDSWMTTALTERCWISTLERFLLLHRRGSGGRGCLLFCCFSVINTPTNHFLHNAETRCVKHRLGLFISTTLTIRTADLKAYMHATLRQEIPHHRSVNTDDLFPPCLWPLHHTALKNKCL